MRTFTSNTGPGPEFSGVNCHHILTRMAQAVAPGPDAQGSQIGKQLLEVEGRQRDVCLLRGLLQAGRGRKSVGQPDVGTVGAKNLGSSGASSVPSPRRSPCLPTPLPSLRTGRYLQELELNLSWLPGVLRPGWTGGPQSQSQACPLQSQVHSGWGAPRRYLECQCDWLSIAESLVSQKLL